MSALESVSLPGRLGALDSLEQFLVEIGRYPLLSAADEVRLAKRAERGDRSARDELITSNLRLVVFVAKRFRTSVQLVDLIQDGMFGLIRAVERYDWRRGYRFSTYATWWIRQAVQRGSEREAGTIRLPAHVRTQLRELTAVEIQLLVDLQRHPTEDEIAIAAALAPEELRALRAAAARDPVSLDAEIGETGPRVAAVASPDSLDDELSERMDSAAVRQALAGLPELERDVIVLRFGIDGGPDRPIRLVGEMLGISTQLVRKLERIALRRLAWSPELVAARG